MKHRTGLLLDPKSELEVQRPGNRKSCPVAFNNVLQDAANLVVQFAPIPVVVHYIICTPPLLVKCHLRLLTLGQFLLIPGPFLPDALQANGGVGIDENHRIAFALQARLEQQRRIDHKRRGVLGRVLKVLPPPIFNPRMRQRFQSLALGRIGENDSRHRRTIDLAIVIQNGRSPPFHQFIANGGIAQGCSGHDIGFGHDAPQFAQDARHRRLARADAAGNADDWRIDI